MKRRVVITGLGVISPIGNGVDTYFENIKKDTLGFAPISSFDTTDFKCKVAAEVKDFVPEQYMDKKTARRMERFSQFAVAAAGEALVDAGLWGKDEKVDENDAPRLLVDDPYRVGCAVSSGVGSMQAMEREHARLVEKGPSKVGPLFVPMMISNMAAGNVSIAYGLMGKSINVVTACASGSHSIGEAARSIQYGEVDVCVAGGTEACVCPLGVAGFSSLTALSTVEDPTRCSLPFDKERSGFVMGEGAGILVLEELEHAKARGAKIYAEFLGYGSTSDAYHITSPKEDGMGAAKAMLAALSDGGVDISELTYINAHGTATHHNDLFETRAIKAAFGEHAKKIKINSTKSMIGHMLGAAGAVELLTCVKEIQEGYIHRTVGFNCGDEEMDLNYCKESYREEIPYALSNSLGFGGHNASLLIGKYKGE